MQAGLALSTNAARATSAAARDAATDVDRDPRQLEKAKFIKEFLETSEAQDLCSALASLLSYSGDAESRKDVAQDLLVQTRNIIDQRQTTLDETTEADQSLSPSATQRTCAGGGEGDEKNASKDSEAVYKEAHSFRGRTRRFCRYFGDMPGFTTPSVGCLRKRVFVCFEDQSPSKLSKLILVLLVLTILLSTVSFLMESMPQFKHRPSRCKELHDLGLPLTVEDCEPQPDAYFYSIEAVCISIFTVDYLLRAALSHVGFDRSKYTSALGRTCDYLRQPMNMVDFLAILPFYVDIAVGDSKPSFIAVLRLARILRIFKLAKHHPGVKIFWEVLVMSGKPLFVLAFLNVIIALVFGTLIYNVEGQQYSVASKDPAHPDGVYVRTLLRWGSSGDFGDYERIQDEEITPFQSIPRALWWVLVTLTTVGYGDYSPKTYLGKTVGVLTFYTGILFLALPISVLGSNMEIVYNKHFAKEMAEKDRERQREREQKKKLGSRRMSGGSNTTVVPFLPTVLDEDMGIQKRIFYLLDNPQKSKLGKAIALWMLAVILIVTATFVLESMPSFKEVPDECQNDKTVDNCEPKPPKFLHYIEVTGIVIFTIDYLLRICTVHVCKPFECGLLVDPDEIGISGCKVTYLYACQLMNIIDLLAVLPFYFQIVGVAGTGATSVLRVLRLVRVFRVLRMPQLSSCVSMFGQIIADSLPALFLLNFMTLLACVLISSSIVFAEGQYYSVDRAKLDPIFGPTGHLEGAYIRPQVSGYGWAESPFTDIPYAFWWFFATATTVGYGDDVPTTTLGRGLGLITFYVGIILLALPITIIGGYFSKHYSVWIEELQEMTLLHDNTAMTLKHDNTAMGDSQASQELELNAKKFRAFEDLSLGSPKGQLDEMRIVSGTKDTVEQVSHTKEEQAGGDAAGGGPGRVDAAALPGEVNAKT